MSREFFQDCIDMGGDFLKAAVNHPDCPIDLVAEQCKCGQVGASILNLQYFTTEELGQLVDSLEFNDIFLDNVIALIENRDIGADLIRKICDKVRISGRSKSLSFYSALISSKTEVPSDILVEYLTVSYWSYDYTVIEAFVLRRKNLDNDLIDAIIKASKNEPRVFKAIIKRLKERQQIER